MNMKTLKLRSTWTSKAQIQVGSRGGRGWPIGLTVDGRSNNSFFFRKKFTWEEEWNNNQRQWMYYNKQWELAAMYLHCVLYSIHCVVWRRRRRRRRRETNVRMAWASEWTDRPSCVCVVAYHRRIIIIPSSLILLFPSHYDDECAPETIQQAYSTMCTQQQHEKEGKEGKERRDNFRKLIIKQRQRRQLRSAVRRLPVPVRVCLMWNDDDDDTNTHARTTLPSRHVLLRDD